MDWTDLTPSDWTRILIYGAMATYVAMMLPRLFRGRFTAGVAALAFWSAAFAVVIAGYAYRYELGAVTDRVVAVLVPGTVEDTGPREVTVYRRPDGQFVINAGIGTTHVPFVLDTGASSVVLRAEDAAKLKIPVRRLVYDIPVSTANGQTLAAETVLPSLSIGSMTETDVSALVARPGALHENLLGMSYLNRLASFTVAKDRLVMRGK